MTTTPTIPSAHLKRRGLIGHGVVGIGNASGNAGVFAQTMTASAYAFYGVASGANAYAAVLRGTVSVQGDFSVTGSKSALLAHPDGSHRLVYCIEAPEAWLEDFGEGTLTNGRADVALDPYG